MPFIDSLFSIDINPTPDRNRPSICETCWIFVWFKYEETEKEEQSLLALICTKITQQNLLRIELNNLLRILKLLIVCW